MSRVSPKVLALLAALTLVWGTNWPLFRVALAELPVFTFRTIVLVSAILTLGVILRLRGESFAVPKGKWPALVGAALSSITIPIVAIVSGVLLFGEPLSLLQAAAIASTVLSLWLALVPGRAAP